MKELILSQQGKTLERIAEFELVEDALKQLNGVDHSCISLSDDDGGYVKVMGRPEMLAVCCGKRLDARINHFVLGLSKRDEEEISLSFQKVSVIVRKNELMTLDDALLIFSRFFDEEVFPEAYNFRKLEKALF